MSVKALHVFEVKHVVSEMARFHRRWALVRFKDGRHEFFDYMAAWQVNDLHMSIWNVVF